MENFHRALAKGNHLAVSKTNPLACVLRKQLVANGPIVCFILPPGGMDRAGDFRWQLIGNASHGSLMGYCQHYTILDRSTLPKVDFKTTDSAAKSCGGRRV